MAKVTKARKGKAESVPTDAEVADALRKAASKLQAGGEGARAIIQSIGLVWCSLNQARKLLGINISDALLVKVARHFEIVAKRKGGAV